MRPVAPALIGVLALACSSEESLPTAPIDSNTSAGDSGGSEEESSGSGDDGGGAMAGCDALNREQVYMVGTLVPMTPIKGISPANALQAACGIPMGAKQAIIRASDGRVLYTEAVNEPETQLRVFGRDMLLWDASYNLQSDPHINDSEIPHPCPTGVDLETFLIGPFDDLYFECGQGSWLDEAGDPWVSGSLTPLAIAVDGTVLASDGTIGGLTEIVDGTQTPIDLGPNASANREANIEVARSHPSGGFWVTATLDAGILRLRVEDTTVTEIVVLAGFPAGVGGLGNATRSLDADGALYSAGSDQAGGGLLIVRLTPDQAEIIAQNPASGQEPAGTFNYVDAPILFSGP